MTEQPRLHTNRQTVSLSFETSLIQSCMRLDDPCALVLDYTRTMMGGLLFNPQPARVLMVGLGGGSMLKYLHAYVPTADLTVVEINPAVIDMRHDFLLPPDSERLRICCDDGARFMVAPPADYDLILVDGFTGEGLPAALSSRSFYQHARQALTPGGVLVANLQADTDAMTRVQRTLHKAFQSAVILVDSDEGGNTVALAGGKDELVRVRDQFDACWHALDAIHQETLSGSAPLFSQAFQRYRP